MTKVHETLSKAAKYFDSGEAKEAVDALSTLYVGDVAPMELQRLGLNIAEIIGLFEALKSVMDLARDQTRLRAAGVICTHIAGNLASKKAA